MLYWALLHSIALHCVVLYRMALYGIPWYCVVLYCVVLSCIEVNCLALHCLTCYYTLVAFSHTAVVSCLKRVVECLKERNPKHVGFSVVLSEQLHTYLLQV